MSRKDDSNDTKFDSIRAQMSPNQRPEVYFETDDVGSDDRPNQDSMVLSSQVIMVYLVRGGSRPNLVERSLSVTMGCFVQVYLVDLLRTNLNSS
ncbi:hypothetical protein M5K25_021465 [Dendrobium thyrsiflorum]|uniref:Uncharacterized protein n=1 Tax=Dendrobium thyrsiflorum TaxID=117978 RepID=A0ABD0UCP4_DENTH